MKNYSKGSASIVALVVVLLALVAGGSFYAGTQTVATPASGAISGPDISSTYISVNGVQTYSYKLTFGKATTTPCSIQSPAATSTIVDANFQINTGTSTAATIDLGTGTTRYATTTNLIAAKSIASGASGNSNWVSAGGTAEDNIMAPNTWVIVKTAGAGLSGYTYGGTCSAQFRVL